MMKTTTHQGQKSDRGRLASENLTPNQQKTRKPRYTLEELLEGADEMAPVSKEAAAWMDMPPVGKEVF
jgi:antitoxin component of MazEF toxin-antitoxin module